MSLNQYQEGDVTRDVIVDYLNKAMPGIHCLHDYMDLKKLCSSAVHDNNLIWIRGLIGSGQTHIYRKLRKKFNDQITEIGKFVKFDKESATLEFTADSVKSNIFVGSFSQSEELVHHLAEIAVVKGKAMHNILNVVHIIADSRFFIELHKFRLSEMRKADLHQLPQFPDYKNWAIKVTNFSSDQYLKYVKSMTTLTSKHIQRVRDSVGWVEIREYFYVPPIEGVPDMVSISN